MAVELDGEELAAELTTNIKAEVRHLADRGAEPGLATIHLGDDPAAATYLEMKQQECDQIGINGRLFKSVQPRLHWDR